MIVKPMKDYRDLNVPPDADPDLWLDRGEALTMYRKEVINVVPPPRNRVNLTDAMRSMLRNLREKAGLTGDEVARITGHTQAWVAHIELGNVRTIAEDDFDLLFGVYTTRIMRMGR